MPGKYAVVDFGIRWLSTPWFVCGGIILVSILSLGMALIAEYVYGLKPCILCIYQRWPYVAAAVLGAAGLAVSFWSARGAAVFIGLSALGFALNAVIAFYHSGVERLWWTSAFEKCDAPDISGDPTHILAMISSTATVPCNLIPWADPFFGLSMANYNVLFCAALAAGCALCAILILRTKKGERPASAPF